MAIKDLFGAGIGFNPGSVKYIITRGLEIGIILDIATKGRLLDVFPEQHTLTIRRETRVLAVIP
jgi:hypothetical protein